VHEGIAGAEIGERLTIGSSEKFVGTGRTAEHPFLFEAFDIVIERAGHSRPIPFLLREPFLGVNIKSGPRKAKTKKAIKPPP